MRSMSRNSPSTPRSGFTLVEILIIAPILILTITGFVVLIITLTGDVMRTKGSSDTVYSTQEALDRIEEDTRLATEFRAESYMAHPPQVITNTEYGRTTGEATISSVMSFTPVKLIIRTLTTDSNPMLATKKLVYKMPTSSGCDPATASGLPYTADVVYYLKPDPTSGTQSLWRRLVQGVPTAATDSAGYPCPTTVFQRRSCTPEFKASDVSGACQTEDVELVKNVSNINVWYLNDAGASLIAPGTSAVAIRVTIETTDTIAGRTSVNSGTLYSKRGNSPVDSL